MPFDLGQRYSRPPEGFAHALREVREQRLPPIHIAVWTLGASAPLVGALDDAYVDRDTVELNIDGEIQLIQAAEIEAVQLLEGPPIDTSDELRGGLT